MEQNQKHSSRNNIVNKLRTYLKTAFQMENRDSEAEMSPEKQIINTGLKSGDIAIDCGANIGDITEIMAQSGATVYAFEPNPYAFQVLSERFFHDDNIICINKGVLDQDGKMKLYLHEFAHLDQVHWSAGSSLLDFKGNIDKNSFVEIEVIDLAKFIYEIGEEIKLVKMDVEGVEYQIIHHLINTGSIEKIKHLLVETHEKKVPELRESTRILTERIVREGLCNIDLEWV